ncbi:MAG: PQQ-binding-like beta-propeller repeat protein, partial [Kiritimatiellales bacterium]|nr:PQQ-binding-like beta-propeller repeat protein [Kiritimatiellales bacterium]
DGSLVWRNDMTDLQQKSAGIDFSAAKTGGDSPHGYLALNGDRLFVPMGRGMPVAFNRKDGSFVFETGDIRFGGSWMMVDHNRLVAASSRSENDLRKLAFDAVSGQRLGNEFEVVVGFDVVADGDDAYSLTEEGITAVSRAQFLDGGEQEIARLETEAKKREKEYKKGKKEDRSKEKQLRWKEAREKLEAFKEAAIEVRWKHPSEGLNVLVLVGNFVFAGGDGFVVAIDAKKGKEQWKAETEGAVHGLAFANGRLFASTETGAIHCFVPQKTAQGKQVVEPVAKSNAVEPFADKALKVAARKRGWCLVPDGDIGVARRIALGSAFNIVCLQPDRQKRDQARNALEKEGLYGVRMVVEDWALADLPLYFADLIASKTPPRDWSALYRLLKPCGGTACLPACNIEAAANDIVQESGGTMAYRRGALPGAGGWTGLYGDVHNSGISNDEALRGPLDLLWFGDPAERELVDRHGRPVGPLSVDGRLILQGEEVLWGYDAYNGTKLWRRDIPGAFRIRVDVDAGNLSLSKEGFFAAVGEQCLQLDPETGKDIRIHRMPDARKDRRWGYVGVVDGVLIGSSSPALNEYGIIWKYWADEENGRWRKDSEVPSEIRRKTFIRHRWWFQTRGEPVAEEIPYTDIVEQFRKRYPVPTDLARRSMHHQFKLYEPVGNYPPWDPNLSPYKAVGAFFKTVASDLVFGIDIKTGKVLWKHEGSMVANIGIAAGDGKVFLLELAESTNDRKTAVAEREKMKAAGKFVEDSSVRVRSDDIDIRRVVALDLKTGKKQWERPLEITGCGGEKTGLIWHNGTLLLAGHFQIKDLGSVWEGGGLSWRRVAAIDAAAGGYLWSKPLNYTHRPVVINGSLMVEPFMVDVRTGEFVTRPHPVTGEPVPFELDRKGKNCAPMQGNKNILFFRQQDICMTDLENDSGISSIGAIRPSCWINMVAANGIALLPVGDSGCACPYSMRTSFAMAPRPKTDAYPGPWGWFTRDEQLAPLKHLGINFGAPGDVRDKDGLLWFAYPRPKRSRPTMNFSLQETYDKKQGAYYEDYAFRTFKGDVRVWLHASGLPGFTRCVVPVGPAGSFTIRMGFPASGGAFDVLVNGKTVAKAWSPQTAAAGNDVAVLELPGISCKGDMVVEITAPGASIGFMEIQRDQDNRFQ